MKKLFKVVSSDLRSVHGGSFQYVVGEWTPVIENVSICRSGYHLTTSPYQRWFVWNCRVFEAVAKDIVEWSDDKCVCKSMCLVKEVKKPLWQSRVEDFVSGIPKMNFLSPDGKPDKRWKLFVGDSWAAARGAAWDAARGAAWDAAWAAARGAAWAAARGAAWDAARAAAWDAARAAALYSTLLICDDLKLAKKHRKTIEDRWNVWRKGYACLCDVDGVLYVYAKKDTKEKRE